MTTDDQDAEVGRLVRERRELRAQYQALLSKAGKTGKLLSSVGKQLWVQPANGPFPTGTLIVEPDGAVRATDEYEKGALSATWPTALELHTLLAEVKAAQQRLKELDGHLQAFGV